MDEEDRKEAAEAAARHEAEKRARLTQAVVGAGWGEGRKGLGGGWLGQAEAGCVAYNGSSQICCLNIIITTSAAQLAYRAEAAKLGDA